MDNNDWINLLAGPLIGGLIALVCLCFGLRAAKRQRLIDNLPTSSTAGVFIGLVELKGTAEAEAPLTSHLAACSCVQYQWCVEEHWSKTSTETYRDSQGHTRTRTRHESGWKTVDSGGKTAPFYLKDDAGVIRVQPEGAEIQANSVFDRTVSRGDPLYYGKGPATSIAHSDHQRRFTEKAIPLHAMLYIVGHARERQDIVAAEIAHDPDAEMFLISTRSEKKVSSGLRWGGRGLGLLGLVLAVGGFAVQSHMRRHDWQADLPVWLTAGGSYAAAWLLGWIWMLYNSLVALRARVGQAWSNIDVQLKRRADLIPRLVEIVKGLRDHEQTVQTQLAELRAQVGATAPGRSGPDPQSCAGQLIAIAEQYPELKANDAFLRLQQNLIDTENRISLARGYFNEIATFYNTRLEVIPDRFIAAIGSMRPAILMSANDFEREPVQVNLADS